eukprot:s6245_g2.t1
MGWIMSRRCPAWFFLLWLSFLFPLFPPKKKLEAEKVEIARAELQEFVAEHGQMPSQHADLASSRSLYYKLKKAKLLHLLKSDWRRDLCKEVQKFYDTSTRLPKRQVGDTEEKRAEDALAQRWDRLLANKATIEATLLHTYSVIFEAAEKEDDTFHLAVCMSVQDFFDTCNRLPKRQVGDTEEKRAEDALAQRWDRLLQNKGAISENLMATYRAIFDAVEVEGDDGQLAVCLAVQEFWSTSNRLPKRQAGHSDELRAEDALAQRWDRLLQNKVSISENLFSTYKAIFAASEVEEDDGQLAVCLAVQEFWSTSNRLPKRQAGHRDELRAEDALAQRWDRLLQDKGVQAEFPEIFEAAADGWQAAVQMGLAAFLQETCVNEVFSRCVVLQEDAVQ